MREQARSPEQLIDGFELSYQQKRAWLLQQDSSAYRAQTAILLEGDLNIGALEEALGRVISRHEILRTTFVRQPGVRYPIQVIASGTRAFLRESMLSELVPADGNRAPNEALNEALNELRRAEAPPLFDNNGASTTQVSLLTLSPDQHLLAIGLPSICADSRTLNNLFDEVSREYAAGPTGFDGVDIVQYNQFSDWHNELLEAARGDGDDSGERFWNGMDLAGLSSVRLPFERRSTPGSPFDPEFFDSPIERSVATRLGSICEQYDVSPALALLIVWKALLTRLTGLSDFPIVYLADGRRHEELQTAMGPFAKSIPLLFRSDSQASFIEILDEARNRMEQCFEWQDYFTWDQSSCDEEQLSAAIGFEFEEWSSRCTSGGLTFSVREQSVCIEPFSIKLSCVRRDGDLVCRFYYDRRRFSPDDISRLASQFHCLLEGVTGDTTLAIGDFSLLGSIERQHLLSELNSRERDYSNGACVHELFERWAARRPEEIALVFEQSRMTYRELNDRANQLAGYLQSVGVGPEHLISICVERSAEMIVGALGIMKAGAAYVPIEPSYPRERKAWLLEETGSKVIVTQRHLLEGFSGVEARTICLDADWEQIQGQSTKNVITSVTGENLAYVLFTSGSTGKPKGVAIEHRQLVNYTNAVAEELKLGEGASYATVSTLSADLGNTAIYPALCGGGTLHVVSQDRATDAEALCEYIGREAVDCLKIVPSHFRALLREETKHVIPRRHLVLGGEACGVELVREINRLSGDVRVLNHYGPTETTVGALTLDVETEKLDERWMTVPIGRPIHNLQAYILNRQMEPAGLWETGELYIGGAGLARGYFNRADLTADRFVPDPFGRQQGQRLYRTGDLARYLPDWSIEYIGRADDQVKLRGYRVELGEIESVLRQHPEVGGCVVILREDRPGDKRLVAYFAGRQKSPLDKVALQQYLKAKLPEYMLPSTFVQMETLPITRNGKIDKQALPIPDQHRMNLGRADLTPHTPFEELIASIWRELLGVEQVGVDDDFFELGGHSLLATQAISRMRSAFHVEIPLRSLFEERTISKLAGVVERALRNEDGYSSPIRPVPRNTDSPLSFAQQRLWLLHQIDPASASYNLPRTVRIRGPLNLAAMERAINELLRRHEVLRTSFRTIDGLPRLSVMPALKIVIKQVDLRDLPEQEPESQVARFALEQAKLPFDLAQAPLLRVSLLRIDSEDHVFVAIMHHLISDAWSMGVFIREIAALYSAFSNALPDDTPSPLPDLPIQYADFAHWQRAWLKGDVLARQIAYWREKLSGDLPVCELPADRPRGLLRTFNGATTSFTLPQHLSQSLKTLSLEESATLFMTLVAAFRVLLFRHTNQEDIIVGTPIANRNRSEIEGLIGFFANTLVLRTDLSGDPGFRELLRRERATALGAYSHQDLPFEKLVEELNPERSLNRTPLFQVMIQLQNTPVEAESVADITLEPLELDTGAVNFDLTLSLADLRDGIAGTIRYNQDLFDPETISRIAEQFETLCESIVSSPDQRISRLRILRSSERDRIAFDLNRTGTDYPVPHALNLLLEAQAARTPDAPAVLFDQTQLSYHELNRRANQLAHFLIDCGVRSDVPVAVVMHRSIEMVVALVAILKAGGAYVPVDPDYPPHRLALLLEEIEPAATVTQGRLLSDLFDSRTLQFSGKVVGVDSQWELISEYSENDPACQPDPENLAYIIYTSGSTGRPKGVMNTHKGVANRLLWMQQRYGLSPADRVLQKTPYTFDVSVWEFFWPLMTGACLVLAEPGGHRDAGYLVELIQSHSVTVLHFVPSMLESFLEQDGLDRCRSVRQVISSGEALSCQLAERFHRQLDWAQLDNLYGPTESAIDVTWWRCDVESSHHKAGRVPIGRPISNVQLYVLDDQMELAPVGVAGQIHLGGVGLARGYFRSADLTAHSFVPDPVSGRAGSRLYRTGDLGRYLTDGSVEYLGRTDEQVKIRGFRIELGEIEVALRQHPSVRASVVLAERDGGSDSRLVAYVIEETGGGISEKQLKEWLTQRLPLYMVPASIVRLEQMPLNSSGKVDKRALAQAGRNHVPPVEAGEEPKGEIEQIVAGIWEQVLRRGHVSRDQNFFEAGGHSLLATQVISRMREAFSVEIGLRDLFEQPTVAGLSRLIELQSKSEAMLHAPAMVRADRNERLPLSFAQQRLWFLHQLEPESPAYNIFMPLRLRGRLDLDALEASLSEIVGRHEVFRTTFPSVDGVPVQTIEPQAVFTLQQLDFALMPEDQREEEVLRFATDEACRAFDLATAPPLRVSLLRLGNDDHMLLVSMHHIISDGWSIGVFVREMALLYEAARASKPCHLEDLKIQYADFAVWQRSYLQGDVLQAQMSYWKERLSGSPPLLELPLDRPRPSMPSFRGGRERLALPAELSRSLKELGRRYGATLFMTLLSAFKVLLYRYSGQTDIVIGTPIANRNRSETEGLIGFFVNTLVIRTALGDGMKFNQLLGEVREAALGAYTHQDIPFELLVEALSPGREISRTPLFQVMFALQNTALPSAQLEELTIEPVAISSGATQFDLTLAMAEAGETIEGVFDYRTDLFDKATIERMSQHYRHVLEQIVAEPEQTIGRVALMTETERRLLIESRIGEEVEYRGSQCLHQLFESQAQETPNSVAIVSGEERLSYRDLDERANQVAHYLKSRGVEPHSLVGIYMERSADHLICLLGVLKAGAVYVPLEPRSPKLRTALLLRESNLTVVLTTERLLTGLPEEGLIPICVDSEGDKIAQQSRSQLNSSVTGEDMAYVIYTSGTTGVPKGVMVGHKAVSNQMLWMREEFALSGSDKLLQKYSIAFDASLVEIFYPLISGASLVVVAPGEEQDTERLVELIQRHAVTAIDVVPSQLDALMREKGIERCTSLRQITCGGEAMSWGHVERVRERVGAELANLYGPTEASITATYYRCVKAGSDGAVPIGRAIGNVRAYVLDGQLEPIPIGAIGELYIGGEGLALGYSGRPDLTAERFVPDPYGKPGARMYRTGDLARLAVDGNLEFAGRRDEQVKIRGFRIELDEIKMVLKQHPSVEGAEVVLRGDGGEEKRLVAYVLPKGEDAVDASQLRSFLKERLPEYMVPVSFIVVESWPLTPNGKIDLAALPMPGRADSAAAESFVLPRDAVELQLAHIWEELLDVRPVGVKDNFFEMGGHSMLTLRLAALVESRLGKRLPLTTILRMPTIEQMAAGLREQSAPVVGSPLVPIQPGGGKQPLFFVHPAGGTVFSYVGLAHQLGPDQPLFGLQATGIDQDQQPCASIEEMATRYIEAVREFHPRGPYLLGGWSFGGVVAFEMARQLQAEGEHVPLLVLLDSRIAQSEEADEEDSLRLLAGFALDIGLPLDRFGRSPEHLMKLGTDDQLAYLLEEAKGADLLPSDISLRQLQLLLDSYRTNVRALRRYKPRPGQAKIALFKASRQLGVRLQDETLGWSSLTELDVEIEVIPGDHYTILQGDNLAVLAERLSAKLEKFQVENKVLPALGSQ